MSYSRPGNSEGDFVRSLIGDTNPNKESFTDEEITDHLAAEHARTRDPVPNERLIV